jgi:hypothetical protein
VGRLDGGAGRLVSLPAVPAFERADVGAVERTEGGGDAIGAGLSAGVAAAAGVTVTVTVTAGAGWVDSLNTCAMTPPAPAASTAPTSAPPPIFHARFMTERVYTRPPT